MLLATKAVIDCEEVEMESRFATVIIWKWKFDMQGQKICMAGQKKSTTTF